MLAWNITEKNIAIVLDGRAHTVRRDVPYYQQVVDALSQKDKVTLATLLDPKTHISTHSEGRVTYDGRDLMFNGEVMHNAITTRLKFLWENGLPFQSLLKFMDRLMENPSNRAVNELYGFLDACELPITEDGYFLAYKRVRGNYMDIHSGTFDNSVGAEPTVRRNEVDEDPNRTCSHGLHVCSRTYLPCYGTYGSNRVVMVKVDPADVVAVPTDYNNSKMRVCRYKVVQDITDEYNTQRDPMPSYHTPDYSDEVEDDSFDDLDDDELDEVEGTVEDDSFDDLDGVTEERPAASPHATSAKLNEYQVREIKRLLAEGEFSIVYIAKLYNVDESTVRKIRDGITWSWVK